MKQDRAEGKEVRRAHARERRNKAHSVILTIASSETVMCQWLGLVSYVAVVYGGRLAGSRRPGSGSGFCLPSPFALGDQPLRSQNV